MDFKSFIDELSNLNPQVQFTTDFSSDKYDLITGEELFNGQKNHFDDSQLFFPHFLLVGQGV